MTTRLTQTLVDSGSSNQVPGTQIYDAEIPGLRMVIGRRSSSYKLVGRINDGTNRYISVVIGRTNEVSLRSARSRATELRLALRRGEDPRSPKVTAPTLSEALDRYLESRGEELRPSTRHWYRSKVDHQLASLRKLPVDRIDRETVRSLHEKITRRNGAYSANGAMRVLKLLLNDVARSHDLPPNPVSSAVRMNREYARDWAVHPSEMPEVWRYLDAMVDRVRRACWLTMLLTGLRCGDARSIRWDHLDDEGVVLIPSPKGGPQRAFRTPLPRLLLQEWEAVRQYTEPLCSPFVFPSTNSRSGHLEQMRRTGEFPYAPHALRHTYRTLCLEAGIDLSMTMVLLNHKPAGVTWNYVTRSNLLGPMREAQERVCAAIASYRSR